ncbi:MAG: carboxymuconolactone decarboxylase family protein [Gammaproteobacteria bacterium]
MTQCPYCIRSHTKALPGMRATPEQIMEAIWVASEMHVPAAQHACGTGGGNHC